MGVRSFARPAAEFFVKPAKRALKFQEDPLAFVAELRAKTLDAADPSEIAKATKEVALLLATLEVWRSAEHASWHTYNDTTR